MSQVWFRRAASAGDAIGVLHPLAIRDSVTPAPFNRFGAMPSQRNQHYLDYSTLQAVLVRKQAQLMKLNEKKSLSTLYEIAHIVLPLLSAVALSATARARTDTTSDTGSASAPWASRTPPENIAGCCVKVAGLLVRSNSELSTTTSIRNLQRQPCVGCSHV